MRMYICVRVSAGLLWSTESGDNPSLRSRGDASLGPAFGSRRVTTQGSSLNSLNGYIREGDMNGDPGREDESWAVSGRPLVYLCAVCSSLCSILLGYDVGVMSGAKEYIKPDLQLSKGRVVSFVVFVFVCVFLIAYNRATLPCHSNLSTLLVWILPTEDQ